jgi:hypothetical protein
VNLDDGLHLHTRILAARTTWLQIERLAARIDDDELTGRVDIARLAILDAKDWLEQLLTDPDAEAEPEAALV